MAGSMVWLLGQIFLIPLRTFVFGMEGMLETIRGIQDAAGRGVQALAAGTAPAGQTTDLNKVDLNRADFKQGAAGGRVQIAIEEKGQEETKQMDKDLNDDKLKLVRYKILFVKRGYEHAFAEQEELVPDNMDGSAFTAWKIAEFIQTVANVERLVEAHRVPVPRSWTDYPGAAYVYGHFLRGFPEADKKYLRVYYEVLERYEREKFLYHEDQIAEMKKQTAYLGQIAAAKSGSTQGTGTPS
jgi:hypothetical protein